MSEIASELLRRRQRILDWMRVKREAKGHQPVLFSEVQAELGLDFGDEAFDGLIRDGVIEAVFPEAKPGDSGRQFWDFAHVAAPA